MRVELLNDIAQIASSITAIVAMVILLVRPIREWVLGTKKIQDGQKCLLRSDMLHTYYKHREANSIRQYEYENFIFEYKAYKALHGNSFIDKIYEEIKTWDVRS